MEKRPPHRSESERPDSADCTKPHNPLRIALSAPLAVDLLILAAAAALLIGGFA